jgi:hypothetical protein
MMSQPWKTKLLLGPVATLASLLMACAGSGSEPAQAREQQMGDALRLAVKRQIENPERSETRTPVEGLGATTAADVVTNYHENQKTTAQQETQNRQRDNGLTDAR